MAIANLSETVETASPGSCNSKASIRRRVRLAKTRQVRQSVGCSGEMAFMVKITLT